MTEPVEISSCAGAGPFFRAMRKLAGWAPVARLFARILPPADRLVSRITGRQQTLAGWANGLQVLMATTGARTGTARTQPVVFLGQGGDFIVIASNFGQQRKPVLVLQPAGEPEGASDRGRISVRTHRP